MKPLKLIVLLFAISNNINAQENYIIAGYVDSNFVYQDIIPDELISANVKLYLCIFIKISNGLII
jgi:hypothetical protein